MSFRLRERVCNTNLDLKYKYAEEWLNAAIELYRPVFFESGYTLPPVLVSVGFSCSGYNENRSKNLIAVCYARSCSTEGFNQIFISPLRTDPVDVLDILGHELIHAVDDCKHGHGKPFYEIARKIGHWDAKNLSIFEHKLFQEKLELMARELGRYPRSPMIFV